MVCYSTDPSEGFLTRQGIRDIRSVLASTIFRQDRDHIYERKTAFRQETKEQAHKRLSELLDGLKDRSGAGTEFERLMLTLSRRLAGTRGKHVYKLLPAGLKDLTDKIVDELAKDPLVAQCYDAWWDLQEQLVSEYQTAPPVRVPLSRQKEFMPIKNAVIREADTVLEFLHAAEEPLESPGPPELTDEDMEHSPPAPVHDDDLETWLSGPASPRPTFRDGGAGGGVMWSDGYKKARKLLYGSSTAEPDLPAAFQAMTKEAGGGNPLAMHDLGRMYSDGLGCDPDADQANQWYAEALQGFLKLERTEKRKTYLQYRIGKMYLAGLGSKQNYAEAARWLQLAADDGHKYAQYSLGALYKSGKGVERNPATAFALFSESAEQENAYASWELGKMRREGVGAQQDEEEAQRHFADAYRSFAAMEAEGSDDRLQYRLGAMLRDGLGTNADPGHAEHYFRRSAELGNVHAQYAWAKLLLANKGAEEKVVKAMELLHRAACEEHPAALYALGKLYRDGLRIGERLYLEPDDEMALVLFTAAADTGHDYAAYQLGKLYLEQEPPDMDAALDWLRESAEADNAYALYTLGTLYRDGSGVEQDTAKALDYLGRSAEQGNQYAQYTLGKLCQEGELVDRDMPLAVEWFQKAARQGNPQAAYQLGRILLHGDDGVLQDIDEAVRWFGVSADGGNPFAQYALGKLLLDGTLIAPDHGRAVSLLRESAGQDNEHAQYALGKFLLGQDTPHYDPTEAERWLYRSAVQGNVQAMYRLGKFYITGEDPAGRDVACGLDWLTRSAEAGNQYAQYALGRLYLKGSDVPRDKETARMWLELAAAQGHEYAAHLLNNLDSYGDPSVLTATVRLLSQMEKAFQSSADDNMKRYGISPQVDRKLLRKLRQKKIAQGHAEDDHEPRI